jgi:membrane associated rhomboid family serine protease
MIPLGDVVPRRTRPVVTFVVATILVGSVVTLSLVLTAEQRWSAIWELGASSATIPWPAFLTASLLEPSWLPGLANVVALLLFGPAVEDRLGRMWMGALLAATAAGSAILGTAVAESPSVPVTGASAPVGAVLGTYLSLFPGSKLVFWLPGTSSTSLHELPVGWAVLVWAVAVTGRFLNLQGGAAATFPLIIVAALGLLAFLGGRHLALPGRREVAWWDGG